MKKTIEQTNIVFSKAEEKFKEFGKKLLREGEINSYKISDKQGMGIVLYRKIDNKQVFVNIDPGSEVFFCTLDEKYTYLMTHYELEDKLGEIDSLLLMAKAFIVNPDYYEEIYEKNGKIIPWKIVWPDGWEISANNNLLTWVKHFFGYKKKKIKPES